MQLDDIFTFEHLYEAHKKCRRSKQHKGEIIRFETNLSVNLVKLAEEIHNKTYRLHYYKKFIIYEPKERVIEAPSYRDRLVLFCFCEYCLKPRFEKRLIYDNVACRKKKGVAMGIKRLYLFLRREYRLQNNNEIYYLKCDIKKYFLSINHDILLKKIKKEKLGEEEIWFIEELLKGYQSENKVGLPLGNQTSQWFALFYLDGVDRLIKEKLKIKGYIRYMDDMILLHRDKKYLQKCLLEIKAFCNKELELSLNNKTQIGKVSVGIDFLGYRHYLTSTGKIVRKLRVSSRNRLKNHLSTLEKLERKHLVDEDYIKIRKAVFQAHLKGTSESRKLQDKVQF